MTPRRKRPDGVSRGFTLIELLLATVVFVWVYLALQTVYTSAARDQRRRMESLADGRRVQYARAVLLADLNQVIYSGGLLAGGLSGGEMAADAGSFSEVLEMTTVAGRTPTAEAGGDVRWVGYRVEPAHGDAPGGVLRRVVRHDLLAPVWDSLDGMVLLEGVAAMECEFYDGSAWYPSWEASTARALPLLVRVRLHWAHDPHAAVRREPFDLIVPSGTSFLMARDADEEGG